MNGMHGHLEILSRPQVIENSRQYFSTPLRYFTKSSRWVPPSRQTGAHQLNLIKKLDENRSLIPWGLRVPIEREDFAVFAFLRLPRLP